MTDFATLRLDADTAGLVLAVDALKDVQAEGAKTEAAVTDAMGGVSRGFKGAQTSARGIVVGMDGIARSSAGASGGLRQLGMQLNHVAQVGGITGNWMQAFAIQLPDMLLGFGGLGVAAGIAAGAMIPLIGTFMDGADGAKALDEAVEAFSGNLDAYRESIAIAAASTAELTEKFGAFAGEVRGFSEFMAGLHLAQTFDSLRVAIDPLKGELTNVESLMLNVARAQEFLNSVSFAEAPQQWALANDALGVYLGLLDEASAELGLTADQARQLVTAMNAFGAVADNSKSSVSDIASAAGNALTVIRQIYPSARDIPAPLRDSVAALEKMAQQAAEASVEVGKMPSLLNSLSAAASIAAGEVGRIAGAAQAALGPLSEMAGRLAAIYNAGIENFTDDAGNFTEFGTGSAARRAPRGAPNDIDFGLPAISRGGGGGGGGGGGALDPFMGDLEALQQNLMTERAIVDQWYTDGLEILNDRRAQEVLSKQEHADLLFQIDQQYALKKLELDEATNNSEVEMRERTVSLLAGTLSALGQHSKAAAVAAVALNAAKSIRETIHHTAVATMRAYAELGPVAGSAAAAKIKAMGAIQIGLIAANAALSLGGGGGGRGGGISAIGTTPREQQAALPTQTLNFTIENDSFGIGEGIIRQIVAQLNKASRNGSNIVATVSA